MANSEVKKGTKDGEEASVPLNLKTSVLRVSIHCEGCKRKVEKILKKIQGVCKTEIDLKQQMVTVTGNIDAQTLIDRLRKKGKNAELWPQKPQEPGKAKNKGRKSDPNSPKEPQKERQSVKTEAPDQDQSDKVSSEGSGKEASKGKATQDSEPATDRAGAEAKELKQEGEENAAASDNDRPAAEKQPVVGESEGGAEKSCSHGSAGKKKKKQGQNGKNPDGEVPRSGEALASTGSGSEEQKIHVQSPKPNAADRSRPRQQAGQHPAPPHSNDGPAGPRSQHEGEGRGSTLVPPNHAAPRHHEHGYRPPHHAPPAHAVSHHAAPPEIAVNYHFANPSYAVSYHTENPSTSYTASHYAPNPPPRSHAYVHRGMEEEWPPYYSSAHHLQPSHTANPSAAYAASHYAPSPHTYYVHPGTEEEHRPYYSSAYHLPPPNSFEMFSDENPNACSIM